MRRDVRVINIYILFLTAETKDYLHFFIMRNIAERMFSWMNKEEGRRVGDVYESVTEGLKNIYKQKLLPLEKEYQFHDFHSPALDEPDFDAK